MSSEASGKKAVNPGVPTAQIIPLKGMRKKISEHMIQSHLGTARVTVLHETEVTELVAFRRELNGHPERTEGLKISYTHLIMKAVAQNLRKHLIINSSLVENEIHVWDDINLGMAVALPDENLIVPVIPQADRKNILEIARRANDLQERATSGKLVLADVQKGTFTISNVGVMPEARWGTPIINQAQCAILGTGAIRQAPVIREGQIAVGWVLTTSLTYDHRIVNGIPVHSFMQDLIRSLRDPSQIQLGM